MAKDFIINTSGLNAHGSRVITSGIDTAQFRRNPVLLYMHRRGWDGTGTPIGRVENLRVEGDELRGTPVFDEKDAFAAGIGRKWEEGFLRACSAGIDPVELSESLEHLLPGQTRAMVTRSKLVEVSIVDIGANDDALQVYSKEGRLLTLAAGEESTVLPLLRAGGPPEAGDNDDDDNTNDNNNHQTKLQMNTILQKLNLLATATGAEAVTAITALQENVPPSVLQKLGLPATATGTEAVTAITALQESAGRAEKLELSRIEAAVDASIASKCITADKRDVFITLGKSAGLEVLQSALDVLTPSRKPTEVIRQGGGAAAASTVTLSYRQMDEEQLQGLLENNPDEFARVFKAEFGHPPAINK